MLSKYINMPSNTTNFFPKTENIINTLQKLDRKDLDENDGNDNKNKTICKLINIHLRDFYDDIYIPYNFFKNDSWNINKILYNNEDILFYNKIYLAKENEERFYQVFNKFILMLEEIFSTNNKLFIFLKNWTDMSDIKWKTNGNKSYLKSLLTDKQYQYISPVYTADIFTSTSKKYKDDANKIKFEVKKQLDEIVRDVKKEIRIFKNIYNGIVTLYVYKYPHNNNKKKNVYVLEFIKSVILSILDFSEKLINLNVYAIHPIVEEITGYYIPLDIINQYDPVENNNRKLYIV